MDSNEKLAAQKHKKEQGTAWFKTGDWATAAKRSHHLSKPSPCVSRVKPTPGTSRPMHGHGVTDA